MLLNSDFTLRVGDFGLSRRLYEGDEEYQTWRNHVALPIRYTAPEALALLKFTTSSECWSFGVVMWELFTFAVHQPYFHEIENTGSSANLWPRLESFLKAGGRLAVPDNVPENL